MAKVKVTFHECIQDSQEYGSNEEHMVSRVFFSIEVSKVGNGKMKVERYDDLYADLKQAVGGEFEKTPIEVGLPKNHKGELFSGPMNYEAFHSACEKYYRSLVGSKGFGIHIEGERGIRMYNNRFVKEFSLEFEADETRASW